MLKRLFQIAICLCLSIPSWASHVVGSDFTYQCLGNDTYRFTLSIYRDCRPSSQGGGNPPAIAADDPAYISIFRGNGTLFASDSIFAFTQQVIPPNIPSECVNNYPFKCLNRIRFSFNYVLPANASGYTLVYQRCCRNESILNITNPGGTGSSFVCFVPPNMCNSSPVFKNDPPQIICVNNPIIFDNSATDADGDSLSYSFCPSIRGGTTSDPKPFVISAPPYPSVIYNAPFSALNPMAGNPQISIDPVTGIITGTPNLQGIFSLTVCCTEWRNGVAINTSRRDFQVEVTNCSKAVVANIPVLSQEPNTYIIQCKGLSVDFINRSTGGFEYKWDFGVDGINTDTSSLFAPSYTYPDTGTYVVKLLVNEGTACADSIERLVKVYPNFDAEYTQAGLLCPSFPIDFTDLSTSSNFPVSYWNWNFGDGTFSDDQNPTHIYANNGLTYNVTLISGNDVGCRDTVSKTFEIKKVNLQASLDTTVLVNQAVQLFATGTQSYNWNPSTFLDNPNISNPIAIFPDTGRYDYIVTGTTFEGCPAFDSVTIYVTDESYIIIPNAFSPNGDGNNDVIRILGAGFTKLNYFQIYNRWGERVFETNNFRDGWDGTLRGKKQPIGTFFWTVSVIDLNNRERSFRGDVTLIR